MCVFVLTQTCNHRLADTHTYAFTCVFIDTTVLKFFLFIWVAEVASIYLSCAGRKNLVLRAQNLGYNGEQHLIDLMDSEKEAVELNRNLYPNIEPYSSGFLKVSDIHTIYWEQSGNPNGHVSSKLSMFRLLLSLLTISLYIGYFNIYTSVLRPIVHKRILCW